MKRAILIIGIILIFAGISCASPFLVCDPQPGVTEYEVVIEQNDIPVMGGIVPAEPDTTVRFDLEGIPNGTYNAKAKAGNLWGWSEWSLPFGFVVQRCGEPQNIRLMKGE